MDRTRMANALMSYGQPRNALLDYTTADVLNTPISRGSILPLTEYADRAEFDLSSGIPGMIGQAMTAPSRAWRGEVGDEQMVPEAVNLAGLLTLGGYMSPKPMNAVGSGGGKLSSSGQSRSSAATPIESPAARLGYADDQFYRGEAKGTLPDEYDAAFFSRDQEYAQGFARAGGQEAPREFRLNLENSFSDNAPVNAKTYVRLAESVAAENPKAAADMIDMIAPGKDLQWAKKFAEFNPDFDVADSGALVRQMVETNVSSIPGAFKRAGFDAIDTGRDVWKLSGQGIRHVDAEFDPAKKASRNIFAGLGGLGLLAGSQDFE